MDRLGMCLKVLADRSPLAQDIFAEKCRHSLEIMLQAKLEDQKDSHKKEDKTNVRQIKPLTLLSLTNLFCLLVKVSVHADDPIGFTQLSSKYEAGGTENLFDISLSQALGHGANKDKGFDFSSSKLGKVTQLTGI